MRKAERLEGDWNVGQRLFGGRRRPFVLHGLDRPTRRTDGSERADRGERVPHRVGLAPGFRLRGQPRVGVEEDGAARLSDFTRVRLPVGAAETGAYIRHRLEKVGWKGVPRFEPGAFEEIHRDERNAEGLVDAGVAAVVAAATVGFAIELHIPKGMMLVVGMKSMMVAMGSLAPMTFLAGSTTRAEGAAPKEHEHGAPFTTRAAA